MEIYNAKKLNFLEVWYIASFIPLTFFNSVIKQFTSNMTKVLELIPGKYKIFYFNHFNSKTFIIFLIL